MGESNLYPQKRSLMKVSNNTIYTFYWSSLILGRKVALAGNNIKAEKRISDRLLNLREIALRILFHFA